MIKGTFKILFLFLSAAVFSCGSPPDIEVTVPADWPTGEPFKIMIPGGKARIRLLTPQGSEQFKVILHTSEKGGYDRETKISGNISQADVIDPLESKIAVNEDTADLFDSFLRGIEIEAARKIDSPFLPRISAKFLPDGPVPDEPPPTANFKVLNNYFSTDSYAQVTANRLTYSENSVIYVDNDLDYQIQSNPKFGPAITRLRSNFDGIIAPILRYYFGNESDVDGFKPIVILMSPVVNDIDTGGAGSVLGFFYSGDLLNHSDHPASNGTEIFYIAAPKYPETIDYVIDNIAHGTLAHEFQHMINFNMHVLAKGGGKSEEIWLNEGLSHLAEDITGYGAGNIGRINRFFFSPADYPLATKRDTSGTRGAAYLFMRYLQERFDPMQTGWLLKGLASGEFCGTKNISKVLDTAFLDVYQDWLVTLALSGTSVAASSIYEYNEPLERHDDSSIGPFQIGIDIRGLNNGSQLLDGPKTEALNSINLSLKPSSSSFYQIRARDRHHLDINLTLKNNAQSGAIIIPTAN